MIIFWKSSIPNMIHIYLYLYIYRLLRKKNTFPTKSTWKFLKKEVSNVGEILQCWWSAQRLNLWVVHGINICGRGCNGSEYHVAYIIYLWDANVYLSLEPITVVLFSPFPHFASKGLRVLGFVAQLLLAQMNRFSLTKGEWGWMEYPKMKWIVEARDVN